MIHEQRIMHEIIFLRMFNQHQYFKLPRIIRNVYNFPHYKSGKMFYKNIQNSGLDSKFLDLDKSK